MLSKCGDETSKSSPNEQEVTGCRKSARFSLHLSMSVFFRLLEVTVARSLAMTFLALTLLFIPALAYGESDSAEYSVEYSAEYDRALDTLIAQIRDSEREGAPFEPVVRACLYKHAQHLAAKIANMRVNQLHNRTPDSDSEIDASRGWDECFQH